MVKWRIFSKFKKKKRIIMKNPNHLTMADKSALNLLAKVTNKFESEGTILSELVNFASSVPDFRRSNKGNIRHRLRDMLILIVFARASGRVGRVDIIDFGRSNLGRFQKMGMLKNGVPSEATLCRVENGIDDTSMANRMQKFAESLLSKLGRERGGRDIICVDGKATRGTVLTNGRNPDIVSAYSPAAGITLATEACEEKSNEIKAVPALLKKIDLKGKIVTADAMSMQKEIIDIIRSKGGDFLIELKANQRSLRYGIEDKINERVPRHSYTQGPELGHGRIETRTYHIYDGLDMIADAEKWGGNMTVVKYESNTDNKSTKKSTTETRLYLTSLPKNTPELGSLVRTHWSIESMHWSLDVNLQQDRIKRKYIKSARNLDTIQRIVHSTFSIWKRLRKKMTDRRKGMAELMRHVAAGFTKLIRFLLQK